MCFTAPDETGQGAEPLLLPSLPWLGLKVWAGASCGVTSCPGWGWVGGWSFRMGLEVWAGAGYVAGALGWGLEVWAGAGYVAGALGWGLEVWAGAGLGLEAEGGREEGERKGISCPLTCEGAVLGASRGDEVKGNMGGPTDVLMGEGAVRTLVAAAHDPLAHEVHPAHHEHRQDDPDHWADCAGVAGVTGGRAQELWNTDRHMDTGEQILQQDQVHGARAAGRPISLGDADVRAASVVTGTGM
ncbi:hypothetical protein JZ751_008149 [Albula glossodonta]|uniref:Uncharacterized protein n=1 Tax=Albula glossodonta TaxID=121402 RepID=A0A8T2N4S4_9TELE|nr:hypothetical protein JZ751_008149 [Albula glossodonta]